MSNTLDLVDAPTGGGEEASPAPSESAPRARKRAAGLSGMVLSELQAVASGLGISGTGRMRKTQLIEAIRERQGGGSGGSSSSAPAATARPGSCSRHPSPGRGGAGVG